MEHPRPTKAELEAARNKRVRDVIAEDLDVLFCGINPGLYTAAIGHHFGRPGNRFWPALHLSGFTPRLFTPYEEHELLDLGLGITNLVARTTPGESELSKEELKKGAATLRRKVARYHPRFLAVLGVGAYRTGFGRPKAQIGPQEETLGATGLWVLPNPSGLNAHYQLDALATHFGVLAQAVGRKI
ncbi:MAG TPA: G/U mismatch-specific DNA glycosylase [Actinomycetota bacterium]|nr:G/U mismatch-specific DNA glycosylase [Actinomycetota bacterium]